MPHRDVDHGGIWNRVVTLPLDFYRSYRLLGLLLSCTPVTKTEEGLESTPSYSLSAVENIELKYSKTQNL
jgi:hypothetical protein